MCLTRIIWMVNESTRSFLQFSHKLVVLNKENTTQNIRKPAGEELELQEIVINRPTISNPILKNTTLQRRAKFELPPPEKPKFQKLRPLPPIPSSAPITDAQSQQKNLSTEVSIFAIA